jgi:hypothetical protein
MNQAFAVQQLRDKRAELEKQLAAAIKPLLDAFQSETSLTPLCIEVRMQELWPLGNARPHRVLESVRVTLDL